MPSLPSNIKGSIGTVSGAANGNQGRGVSNDNQSLNIMAANDIAFAGDYKAKFRNFAGQNTQHSASNNVMMHGGNLRMLQGQTGIQPQQSSPAGTQGNGQGYNFMVQNNNT